MFSQEPILFPNPWRNARIGLGSFDLHQAVEFAKTRHAIGVVSNEDRIETQKEGSEVMDEELTDAKNHDLTSAHDSLESANANIVSVSTPIEACKRSETLPLTGASESVVPALKGGDIEVYKATIYPSVTEEDYVPVFLTGGLTELLRRFLLMWQVNCTNQGLIWHQSMGCPGLVDENGDLELAIWD